MATHHPIRKTVSAPAPVIPDKLYFRIGDVARICEVPAYVLRFWETEFPNLKPNKGGTGQRLYRRKDVETALRIKHLLYDLGYTIPGARQVFKSDATAKEAVAQNLEAPAAPPLARVAEPTRPTAVVSPISTPDARLLAIRDELRALHAQLSASISTAPAPKPLRPRLVAKSPAPTEMKLGPIALPGQQALFPAE